MAQSDIKITFEDWKPSQKKYPSANGTIDKQILLTQKFKELLLEFCVESRRSKRLSDQVVAEKLLELSKKSKSNKEVTYDEFIAASYGE
jgi:hypothetical protein